MGSRAGWGMVVVLSTLSAVARVNAAPDWLCQTLAVAVVVACVWQMVEPGRGRQP